MEVHDSPSPSPGDHKAFAGPRRNPLFGVPAPVKDPPDFAPGRRNHPMVEPVLSRRDIEFERRIRENHEEGAVVLEVLQVVREYLLQGVSPVQHGAHVQDLNTTAGKQGRVAKRVVHLEKIPLFDERFTRGPRRGIRTSGGIVRLCLKEPL